MNRGVIKIGLAGFWLLIAVGSLLWRLVSGQESLDFHVSGRPFSVPLLTLVAAAGLLCGYNIFGWWVGMMYGQSSRRSAGVGSYRRHRTQNTDLPVERDPNFIFEDPGRGDNPADKKGVDAAGNLPAAGSSQERPADRGETGGTGGSGGHAPGTPPEPLP